MPLKNNKPHFQLDMVSKPLIAESMKKANEIALYSMCPEVLSEIKEICLHIGSEFKSGEYFYLGIGRSPSQIIAGLQEIHGNSSATSFPISLFSGDHNDKLTADQVPETIRKLFSLHLANLTHSKVLLIDFAYSGRTMKLVASWLNIFFRASGISFTPLLIIHPVTIWEISDMMGKLPFFYITAEDYWDAIYLKHLMEKKYRSLGMVGKFEVLESTITPPPVQPFQLSWLAYRFAVGPQIIAAKLPSRPLYKLERYTQKKDGKHLD